MAKVLFCIKENMLETVDDLAYKEGRNRSELIRQALREYLQVKGLSLKVNGMVDD